MKKAITIVICVALILLGIFAYYFIHNDDVPSSENINNKLILSVNDDGEADYTHIQDAIDDAKPGTKIFVHNGIYYENIVINKTLILEGENIDFTIICGMNRTHLPFIGENNIPMLIINYARDVRISNFTLNWSDEYSQLGVQIKWCENITISNNNFTYGFQPMWIEYSNHSLFMNNTFYNCRNSVIFSNSHNNTFSHSNIIGDSWWGLYLGFDSSFNEITYNLFDCPDCQEELQIMWDSGPENSIHHNNFIAPSVEYHPEWGYTAIQHFDDGNREGNYWSDYTGNDTNVDGIGDTSLPWHFDHYPLINPVVTAGVQF